jgi:hypothetical protein
MRRGALLGLVLLPSCASHGVHPLTPQDLATAPYQTTATAALTGSLMYEGGCLLFREDEGRTQLMPVWPNGSVFNGTTLTFHQPGKAEQLIVIAQEFQMEGQPIRWSVLSAPAYARIHRQCGAQAPFFVNGVRPAN